MMHQHNLTWRQDTETSWSAVAGDRVVARISLERQYELTSADGAVRGSHSALGSAQAQLEAWYQWESSVDRH
ncbi:hypothetical protein [Curtobacterium sp. ER1/6]|uniref:hypothetical protein n=1 Tax=Curtobacterium sp. ER1/6 TaxID=1891920 RepID=UPI00084FA2A9|nr:hypothetical protein [Curtobacterium sp. ER1/6]OEI68421.1 hypothetical protein Cus16_2094 [Curtobacterium sp. ER1/6]